MKLSRKVIVKLVGAILCLLTLAFSGYQIYHSKFSADTISKNNSSFSGLSAKPDVGDPAVVQLPSKYSKDEIKSAQEKNVNNTKGMSAKDKEIVDYVREESKNIAKNVPLVKDGENRVINDLVIKVVDSERNPVYTTQDISMKTVKTVAENFVFQDNVTARSKELLIQSYPIIETIYGPRISIDPVKIFFDPEMSRGYYNGWLNEIHLDSREDTPIHELVHAFHGIYSMPVVFEEGMAVKVTQQVVRALNLQNLTQSESLIFSGYVISSDQDFASVDMTRFVNSAVTNFPYAYGSRIMDTLFMEDSDFFKKFNIKLYEGNRRPNQAEVLSNIALILSNIEGQEALTWFASKYQLIDVVPDKLGIAPKMFSIDANQEGYVKFLNELIRIDLKGNYDFGENDFNIVIKDLKANNLLENESCRNIWRSEKYIQKDCNIEPKFKAYDGLIRVEATPTDRSQPSEVRYLIKKTIDYSNSNSDHYYILDMNFSDFAVVTKIATGEKMTLQKNNGYFSSNDQRFNEPGKYKVETYRSKTNCKSSGIECIDNLKIASKIYFRPDNKYINRFSILLPEKNQCDGKINSIVSRSNSVKINTTSKINCGHIFSINNIPVARVWGNANQYSIEGLNSGSSYNLKVFFSSAYGKFAGISRNFKITDSVSNSWFSK